MQPQFAQPAQQLLPEGLTQTQHPPQKGVQPEVPAGTVRTLAQRPHSPLPALPHTPQGQFEYRTFKERNRVFIADLHGYGPISEGGKPGPEDAGHPVRAQPRQDHGYQPRVHRLPSETEEEGLGV